MVRARHLARPRRRFPTVQEFLDSLQPLLANDASEAPPRSGTGLRDPEEKPAQLYISDAFASAERRREPRIPSSIPAGINGKRDFEHSAVIHNASRTGALLITNYRCRPGQILHLSFQIFGRQHGTVVPARVMRVARRHDGRMWQFDVGVRFEVQLGPELLGEIEKRAEAERARSSRLELASGGMPSVAIDYWLTGLSSARFGDSKVGHLLNACRQHGGQDRLPGLMSRCTTRLA